MNYPSVIPQPAQDRFELRARRPNGRLFESVPLRQAKTKAKAKTALNEEFPSILLELRQLGWINENEAAANISFEILDTASSSFHMRPVSLHPLRSEGAPISEQTLWFENLTGRVLKDLRRYQVALIGRSHYQVTSPNGVYSVDLEACAGAGSCTCDDFGTRRSPYREAAQNWPHAIHQDCIHLKHVKFLLGKPFGEETSIPIQQLEDPGQSPKGHAAYSPPQ